MLLLYLSQSITALFAHHQIYEGSECYKRPHCFAQTFDGCIDAMNSPACWLVPFPPCVVVPPSCVVGPPLKSGIFTLMNSSVKITPGCKWFKIRMIIDSDKLDNTITVFSNFCYHKVETHPSPTLFNISFLTSSGNLLYESSSSISLFHHLQIVFWWAHLHHSSLVASTKKSTCHRSIYLQMLGGIESRKLLKVYWIVLWKFHSKLLVSFLCRSFNKTIPWSSFIYNILQYSLAEVFADSWLKR